jgi:hypothetical protein
MVSIPRVPVGVSTVTTLGLIAGAIAAFLGEWASSGDPNTGLGGLVVALGGILFGGRAAQVVAAARPAGEVFSGELVSEPLPAPTPPDVSG